MGRGPGKSVFVWGSQYTHFLYAIKAAPPFRLLATSHEFCLRASMDATDCESVQFVSGLAISSEGGAVLSYGVNDCEGRLGVIGRNSLWRMLRPVNDEGRAFFDRCVAARSQ